ncbi:hypothetical protein SVAN01_06717 [Stagonosporopsis vannaccii]|nr:hypothetical protein SVAN01_06717 [Stagonosporopsis vannaccii]
MTIDGLSATGSPAITEPTTGVPALAPTGINSALLSTGARAGIGVGVAVFALLLVIVFFLLRKLKKNKKQQDPYAKAVLPGRSEQGGRGKPHSVVYAREGNSPVELPAYETMVLELNAQTQSERTELATTENAQEIGQERGRDELAASPSMGGTRSHA